MKHLLQYALVACSMLSINTFASDSTKTIGIIVPLEHQAMTEIVSGFQEELAKKYHGPVNIIVKNAEHDPMLERAIINQFHEQGVDLLAPIGTDAFELTITTTPNQPIIGIAAKLAETQRTALKNKNVTTVDDELSSAAELQFMKAIMPNLKKITVIHSTDDKVFTELTDFKSTAKSLGIAIQDLTIQQTPDLYTISQHIDADSQAIFIFKDHPIVNGIAVLVKQAEQRGIPVIASDDGSVENGAALSLGVREKEIGIKAADLAAQALNGTAVSQLPITTLTQYHVFVNTQHLEKQKLNLNSIKAAAEQFHYDTIELNNTQD